jgi:plastocyanin
VRRTVTILSLLTVAAVLAAGCANDGGEGAGASGGAPQGGQAPTTATTAAGGSGGGRGGYGTPPSDAGGVETGSSGKDDVRIKDFAFDPATIRAEVGQRVKWQNDDAGVTHTVTADGGAFDSGDLTKGKEFSFIFRRAGSFPYRCAIHPSMRGTVTVR